MATPMQFDVLREHYSDTMAMFSRLTIKYNIPEEDYKKDRDQYSAIWLKDVRSPKLEEIDYKRVLSELQAISKPWSDFCDKLYQERENAPVFLDDIELEVPTFIKF
ncbi:MAG: hypothetical protein P8Y43_08460 [Sulfurovaceae bacterium]